MKPNKYFIVLILVLVSNIAFAIRDGKVTLIITPPENEGTGGPFLNYRIEYKKITGESWEEVNEKPKVKKDDKGNYIKQEFEVKDLEENEKYVFRVRVENKIGPGVAGPKSKIVTAKKDNPESIEVQSGEPLGGKTSTSFSNLSNILFTNQVQEARLFYRKEE